MNNLIDSIKTIKDLNMIPVNNDIKAVIFDCFGTLMQIKDIQSPYKYLYSCLAKNGYSNEEYARYVMSKKHNLEDILKDLKITLSSDEKEEFNLRLKKEVDSISLFPETLDILWELKNKGIKIGLCSNLALPYGKIAKDKLISLDHYILSYEVGFIKPDIDIFKLCHNKFGFNKEECLFVGDNLKHDYIGSSEYGFKSLLIKRV